MALLRKLALGMCLVAAVGAFDRPGLASERDDSMADLLQRAGAGDFDMAKLQEAMEAMGSGGGDTAELMKVRDPEREPPAAALAAGPSRACRRPLALPLIACVPPPTCR
jgi:hypothetical protein